MELRPTFRLHPVVEAHLARYMSEHSHETEHYRRMVKENPEHAVKTIMCRKMVQHDELRDLTNRLAPLVKQWVAKTPGLHEKIMEKIKYVQPINAGLAYIDEALAVKQPTNFSPSRDSVRKGIPI